MKHPESIQQQIVVEHLRRAGIFHCAIPNGRGRVKPWVGAIWKREGLRAGAPDLLIFDTPRNHADGCKCVALEMKAIDGDKPTKEQLEFLTALEQRGWVTVIAYGAVDAFRQLTALGYRGLPK